MTATLDLRDHGQGLWELVLARAPVNALSPEFLNSFAAMLADLARRDDVRAVVLSSEFKVFSAGLDLKQAQDFDLDQQRAIVAALNDGFLAQFTFPKPLVAAVNGAAIAGGLFFVLAADLRVAGPRARFGLAEVQVGADFPVGPMEIARATLDPATLRRLMLTGRPIDAAAAQAAGIVDHLVSEADLQQRALAEARALAELPAIAYGAIKAQIRAPAVETIRAAIAAGANAPRDGWFNAETRAAMQRMIAPRGAG